MPPLIEMSGAPWRVLPVGVHPAILHDVADVFAVNPRRRQLFAGLVEASRDLAFAGCERIYVDGSYVTTKPLPGDYDVCWDPQGVDPTLLAPRFLDFSNDRAAQKGKYGGEFFPSSFQADTVGNTFLQYFQLERYTGGRKGIVLVNLIDDPMIGNR